MDRLNRLFEDVLADYEEDKYSLVEIAERRGVSIGFILRAIELYGQKNEPED